MSKLLITGATGITGSHFMKMIDSNPLSFDEYKCIVRKSSNTANLSKLNIKVQQVVGDLEDKDFLGDVCSGIDVILHIANIRYSVGIVEAAIKNKVKNVVLVHTTGIYSNYKSASALYLEIEKQIQKLIQGEDIKITIIRPTMIYGSMKDPNISVFIKMIDKLPIVPVINGGKYSLQPVHQKDVAKSYYLVLQNLTIVDGKDYIISGEKPIDLIEIYKLIAKYLGKKRTFIYVPYPLAYFGGVVLYLISLKKIDLREKIQRMVEPRAYSHELAYVELGYEPIAFANGLKREVHEYKCKKNSV